MREISRKLNSVVYAVILAIGKGGRTGTLDLCLWGDVAPHLETLESDLADMGYDDHERDAIFDNYLAMVRHMRAGNYDKAGAIVELDTNGSIDEYCNPGMVASLAFDAAGADDFDQVCKTIYEKYSNMNSGDVLTALCKSMSLRTVIKEIN